ncbi:MAG: M23 family metallopeptidase, partial [Elusimicrobiota bacterium]
VIAVGRKGGLGKRIEIRHNSTYKTLYGHLSRYRKGLRAGVRVKQGQVIGYVGSTGLSTGPHLHFQVAKRGRWVNFLRLKLPKAKSVSVKDKDAFFAVRDRWMAGLNREPDSTAALGAAPTPDTSNRSGAVPVLLRSKGKGTAGNGR